MSTSTYSFRKRKRVDYTYSDFHDHETEQSTTPRPRPDNRRRRKVSRIGTVEIKEEVTSQEPDLHHNFPSVDTNEEIKGEHIDQEDQLHSSTESPDPNDERLSTGVQSSRRDSRSAAAENQSPAEPEEVGANVDTTSESDTESEEEDPNYSEANLRKLAEKLRKMRNEVYRISLPFEVEPKTKGMRDVYREMRSLSGYIEGRLECRDDYLKLRTQFMIINKAWRVTKEEIAAKNRRYNCKRMGGDYVDKILFSWEKVKHISEASVASESS